MEEIKKVLDMGFEIHSPHYIMNTTNWGDGTKFEYALTNDKGWVEYFYHDGEDESYKEAISTILTDMGFKDYKI